MWARRVGLRPQWPSRIRVTVGSFGAMTVGLVVYQYLSSMTVSDLDLADPVNNEVMCLSYWPQIHKADGVIEWLDESAWFNWSKAVLDRESYVRDYQCRFESGDVGPGSVAGKTCGDLRLPVDVLAQPLRLAFGEGANIYHHVLTGYQNIFFWLGLSLCYATLLHDLCMCTSKYKDKVRDLRGAYTDYYWLFCLLTTVSGFEAMRRLRRGDWGGTAGKILCWVIMPVFIAWAVPFLLLIWWPIAAIVYGLQPIAVACNCLRIPGVNAAIGLSRLAVFTNSVCLLVWGLAATILSLVMLFDKIHRPTYAITFEFIGEDATCFCGCVYRISWSKNWELFLVSFGATLQSLAKGFMCLKGLRNSNWATLLTVKFPVPLNMYPVQWTREDRDKDYINGKPIQHRDENTPVQGEIAFDPFALMDEQKDSANTWCQIRPSKAHRHLSQFGASQEIQGKDSGSSATSSSSVDRNNKLAGPVATDSGVRFGKTVEDQDFCCGFACVKFRKKGDHADEKDDYNAPVPQAPGAAADSLAATLLQAPGLADLSQERRSDLQARLARVLEGEMIQPEAPADDAETISI